MADAAYTHASSVSCLATLSYRTGINMFRWWNERQLSTQQYRLRLEAVIGDLRMSLSDVTDPTQQSELGSQLSQLETGYRSEIQEMQNTIASRSRHRIQ